LQPSVPRSLVSDCFPPRPARSTLAVTAHFTGFGAKLKIDPLLFDDSLTPRLKFQSEKSWEAWFFST
jgi:hypothetical protein